MALYSLGKPALLKDIRDICWLSGYKITQKVNMSSALASRKGKAIKTPNGWEITKSGIKHLKELGIPITSSSVAEASHELRDHCKQISNSKTRAFVEEAINAHEHGLYRSSIVLSWVGAVSVLHEFVVEKHLTEFNQDAKRINAKWKDAVDTGGLSNMKEHDFLECLVRISVFDKSVKDELQARLKLRNGCGHPNSLEVSTNASATHLEVLLKNVFQKFL